MTEEMEEIELLFKKMLKNSENCQQDMIYQDDIKDIGKFQAQWKICGIKGYQIFEADKISYKFGEELEEPDVTLIIDDKNLAIRFLKLETFDIDYGIDKTGNLVIKHTVKRNIVKINNGVKRVRVNVPFLTTIFTKNKRYHPYMLSKLPIFRNLLKRRMNEEDMGVFIPINKSLGKYEKQVIPYVVFKHFIEKASNIVMMKNCGCRNGRCKDHAQDIGCMYMGTDTIELKVPENRGGVVTKEEALKHVERAIENGLIPLLGRAMDEAEGFGVPDTGHFLSMCFCCPCCCIDGVIVTNASTGLNIFQRMDGLTVGPVDEDLCTGCEECLDVCVFKGIEMIDDKAFIRDKYCLGCGRCESVCPSGAISITLDDKTSRVKEIIDKIESHVEVS